MPKYLQKRRRKWYAILEIPKTLRPTFNKPRFVQSLETESLTIAETRVLPVVHQWKQLIETAKSNDGSLGALTGQFRVDAERLKNAGVPDHEIQMAHEDLAITLSTPDSPTVTYDNKAFDAYQIVHEGKTLLSEHIDEYLESLDVEAKTLDGKRRDLNHFAQTFVMASDANKVAVRDWVNNTLGNKMGLSVGTRGRVISNCRGYWDYLEKYKQLDIPAPFHKVLPPKPKKKTKTEIEKQRKAFRVQDYHQLLTGCDRDPTLADLIRLAAYTGCRIEELCSLKIQNVADDRFEILDAKSEAGWRTIPIHNDIKQVIARLVDTATGQYLISGLSFNKYGDRSNAIGKRFGRLKKRLGYGPDYVFHSLRKGFATQLENAGVPHNVAARLMGHELSDMTFGGYSDGLMFERLREAMSKVDYSKQYK